MAKKLGTATGSKLAGMVQTVDPTGDTLSQQPPLSLKTKEPLGLVSKRQTDRKPRSYRLRPSDLERLTKTVEAVSELSNGRRITETDVLRGLLVIGEKIDTKQLLEAIRAGMM